ncbi:probable RNA-directed DNA polymerase from transposon X-element [Trichonephila clavipes]|nr:probable RNA-directed DNA polymerase from transposon X-element [Trichonephila clavipes]
MAPTIRPVKMLHKINSHHPSCFSSKKTTKPKMAAITKAFPKIRSRLTGEFLKLYTDSAEERRMAVQHLKILKFQFYTIKSKAERPIKIVIKGLPRNTNPEEIKQDLELLGYTPDRVNQLIGRKNKRPLPIFLITLPRNLDNLKIFDLKTLNYLSIRVEGYDDNWKEAIIFPINKLGKDPHLASSYRPISLLSTIGKLTESIILHRLKNFINENNILNPNQYGFTNKLSTLHPLLKLTENISEGFQKKKSTGAVFLDIQKAYDHVWINGLTFKLITFKIPHPLIHLIHSYLTNRFFRIRINETLSNEHSVFAVCPKGSLLGPLLFNLYINDIPDYSLTKINLYADDIAIHATYKKLETFSFALNKHLLLLQNFYDKWKISINVEKSTAIIFTKKQSLPPPIIIYNKQIPWSQEAKYLEIIFDTHLTWKQHIYYVRDKFRKIMFKLYPLNGRNSYLSIENKVLLYTAVMRPILAYASPVWGYAAKTNINTLDTLQNSLIRMIVKATRYMRNDDIPPGAANRSQCSLYPASNQRAISQLSAKQKTLETHHPDEEHKPRLPDPIAQPITNMPLSRMENTTFAMPSIIDSHDMGLRTVYSPDAQKKTPIQSRALFSLPSCRHHVKLYIAALCVFVLCPPRCCYCLSPVHFALISWQVCVSRQRGNVP